MTTRPRILYLPLEFTTWQDAQYWSYPMGLGLEEGFAENQFPWLTIPAWFGSPTGSPPGNCRATGHADHGGSPR